MSIKAIKRGRFWYARGTQNGKPIFISTGILHAGRIKEPREVTEFIADLQQREKPYVADAFERAVRIFLTAGGSPRYLDRVADFLGNDRIGDISQERLDEGARKAYPNVSAETLNRQFYTPFIAVWSYNSTGQNPLCPNIKWRRPKFKRSGARSRKAADYKQAVKFINACPPYAAKIMLFLFYTGCRPLEAFTLRCENVYPDRKWAVLIDTKTGVPRGIPLHNCLIPMMKAEIKRGGKVFRTQTGKEFTEGRKLNAQGRILRQSSGQIKKAMAIAKAKTGIDTITPYVARHTVSTYLARHCTSYEKDLILGHAKGMSGHYVHLENKELIRAINKLPDPKKLGLVMPIAQKVHGKS